MPSQATLPHKYLCLTVCGYRKAGMSEEACRHYMTQISASMTEDLMVKYGINRWTVIHNTTVTRELMNEIYDSQMANVGDFDCFSQVVFKSLEDYKRLNDDPWYKERLFQDHAKFAIPSAASEWFGRSYIDSRIILTSTGQIIVG